MRLPGALLAFPFDPKSFTGIERYVKLAPMRWFFIDRLTLIEKGRRVSALKNVALGEDYLHDIYPGFPVLPNSLVIESMAQAGGMLIGHVLDFRYPLILAKVASVTFNGFARPGDTLEIEAVLQDEREGIFRVEGAVTIDGRPFASGRLIFARYGGPVDRNENFVFNRTLLSYLDINGVVGRDG